MTDMLLGTLVALTAAILAVLIVVAFQLRGAARRLDKIARLAFRLNGGGHCDGDRFPPSPAYSIWIFEKGAWVLLQPCGRKGCTCGPPPARPGNYDGEVVRKECPRLAS